MAGRKLAVKPSEEEVQESAPEILNVDTILSRKTLTEQDITTLVDIGCDLDEMIKKFSADLDKIKDRLKLVAEDTDAASLEGSLATAVVSPSTKKIIGFASMYQYLKRVGKLALVADLVSVKIQAFETVFGIDTIKEIGKIEEKRVGSIRFKRKK